MFILNKNKHYGWILFALIYTFIVCKGVCLGLAKLPLNNLDKVLGILHLFGALAIWGYALKKKIVFQEFWRFYLIVDFMVYLLDSWIIPNPKLHHYPLEMTLPSTLLIALPYYIAMFRYGFASKEIWGHVDDKKSIKKPLFDVLRKNKKKLTLIVIIVWILLLIGGRYLGWNKSWVSPREHSVKIYTVDQRINDALDSYNINPSGENKFKLISAYGAKKFEGGNVELDTLIENVGDPDLFYTNGDSYHHIIYSYMPKDKLWYAYLTFDENKKLVDSGYNEASVNDHSEYRQWDAGILK
ncbi:MAG: hypothetical protein ABII88_09775 [Candidatus Omnitrophota bacterium]